MQHKQVLILCSLAEAIICRCKILQALGTDSKTGSWWTSGRCHRCVFTISVFLMLISWKTCHNHKRCFSLCCSQRRLTSIYLRSMQVAASLKKDIWDWRVILFYFFHSLCTNQKGSVQLLLQLLYQREKKKKTPHRKKKKSSSSVTCHPNVPNRHKKNKNRLNSAPPRRRRGKTAAAVWIKLLGKDVDATLDAVEK